MTSIPYVNLFNGIEPHFEEYMDKIAELIKKTEFIGGEEVSLFEMEFAKWTGSKYAIGCANGTDAIIIALKALGIGPGDKVLVPVNTFIATSEAVTMVGADVDFIDVEEQYYTIDPAKIELYLKGSKGKNVKALIPVHLYGQMANMPPIMEIARKYGLKVIEDSAQAHGSKLNGNQPGFYGDVATYSFYPGKNIGAFGDAGAITTNDEMLYQKCKMLVNHGRWQSKYKHEIEGFNMRLDTIQAAVLRIKLKYIDGWTAERKNKAAMYIQRLADINRVTVPRVRSGADPVWHIFPVLVESRDEMQKILLDNGISTGINYPIPLHLQPAYSYKKYSVEDFPIAERHARLELSLPFWPEILSEDIDAVARLLAR
jgi:dTDP-4-amino-4,6-dideoxygalactose transaminase